MFSERWQGSLWAGAFCFQPKPGSSLVIWGGLGGSPRWVTSLLPRLRRSWAGERRLLQLLTGEDGERGELRAQFPPSLLLRDLSRHLLPR